MRRERQPRSSCSLRSLRLGGYYCRDREGRSAAAWHASQWQCHWKLSQLNSVFRIKFILVGICRIRFILVSFVCHYVVLIFVNVLNSVSKAPISFVCQYVGIICRILKFILVTFVCQYVICRIKCCFQNIGVLQFWRFPPPPPPPLPPLPPPPPGATGI